MGTRDCDPWRTVRDCIAGQRGADDEVMQAVGVLTSRLEGLRRSHPALAGVGFSPHVESLVQAGAVAVS
jgi:hypothetical protein